MSKLISIFLILLSGNCAATAYFVSKAGSDSNDCTSLPQACFSINKALSLATQPGDTVDIGAGTYIEDSSASPYWPGDGCGLLDGNVSSICVFYSGTAENPIIVRAAPGAERQVIIDSQYTRSGLSLTKSDYVHIKNLVFKNSWVGGICNPGGPATTSGPPLESNLSIGVLIEGNVIDGVETEDGVNSSGIYFWSTKDWIIRNNYIDTHHASNYLITTPNGMQTYGTINALIEYNTVVNTNKSLMFKDHYIASASPTVHTQEAIIRYNLFLGITDSILYGVRGTATNPTGNNEIYGNVLQIKNANAAHIGVAQGAHSINGTFRIYNNIFTSASPSGTVGISISSATDSKIYNNIIMGSQTAIRCGKGTYTCNLSQSNYNIFDPSARFTMDNSSGTERTYTSLSAWKAATDAQTDSLLFDSPDANSTTGNLTNFKNQRPVMFRGFPNTVGAQKAGVYQVGTETVGANFTYRAAPSAPN